MLLLLILSVIIILFGCTSSNNQDESEPNLQTPSANRETVTPPITPTLNDSIVRLSFFGESAFRFEGFVNNIRNSLAHSGFTIIDTPKMGLADVAELERRLNLEHNDPNMINAIVASFSDFAQLSTVCELYLAVLLDEPSQREDAEYIGLFLRESLDFESNLVMTVVQTGFRDNIIVDNAELLVIDDAQVRQALRTALDNTPTGRSPCDCPPDSTRIAKHENDTMGRARHLLRHAPSLIGRGSPPTLELISISIYPSKNISVNVGDELTLRVDINATGDIGDVLVKWFDESNGDSKLLGDGNALSVGTTEEGAFHIKAWAYWKNENGEYERTSYYDSIIVSVTVPAPELPVISGFVLGLPDVDLSDSGVEYSFYRSEIGNQWIPITVEANADDGGTLLYQWYQVIDDKVELIPNETSNHIRVPTNVEGTFKLRVDVTNTLSDRTTEPVRSEIVTIIIINDVPKRTEVFEIYFNGKRAVLEDVRISAEAGRNFSGDQLARLERIINDYVQSNHHVSHIRVDGRFYDVNKDGIDDGLTLRRAEAVKLAMERLGVDVPIHTTGNLVQTDADWQQRRVTITIVYDD